MAVAGAWLRERATRPFRSFSLRSFGSDRRGATAVEFALIMIPFMGLLLALFQAGIVFFTSEALEAAVEDAARNIYTGNAQTTGVSSASQFVSTFLCPTTGGRKLPTYVDCSKLIVDVRTAASFSAGDTSADFWQAGSTQQFCPGGEGDIVIVRVIYPLPAILPALTGTIKSFGTSHAGLVDTVPNNAGWKQLLIGTAVFQNEPFGASTPPTGC
jgi:Flp pilus assembly protein TadG